MVHVNLEDRLCADPEVLPRQQALGLAVAPPAGH
jgi:hypothetical protein